MTAARHSTDDPSARLGVSSERPLQEAAERLSILHREGQPILLGRYRYDDPHLGVMEPKSMADYVLASIEMRPLDPTDMFRNGRHMLKPAIRPGALALYDLRESWVADLRNPVDNVCIFMPLDSFRDFAAERGQTFEELRYRVEEVIYDGSVVSAARRIMSCFEAPNRVTSLFLEHIHLAMRDHLAASYGVFSGRALRPQRGLGRHQLHAALEFIEDNLAEDILLADVAEVCNSSVSSLVRGFKAEYRTSPHRWIVNRRIVLAQRLMRRTNQSLSEISASCGFVDQSHFSHVFAQYVGISPAAWRHDVRR